MEELLHNLTSKKSYINDGPGYCYVVVRYSPGDPLPKHLIESPPGFHRGPLNFAASPNFRFEDDDGQSCEDGDDASEDGKSRDGDDDASEDGGGVDETPGSHGGDDVCSCCGGDNGTLDLEEFRGWQVKVGHTSNMPRRFGEYHPCATSEPLWWIVAAHFPRRKLAGEYVYADRPQLMLFKSVLCIWT